MFYEKKITSFIITSGNNIIINLYYIVAYPMMVVSIVLMIIGIAYNGYCFGKKKSPYDFKS